jgi:hypothetical protein
MKKKTPNITITELYLIKADWKRTFFGQIVRETDVDGHEVIRGNVVVNEGKIWGCADNLDDLGNNLDAICVMKLDKGLHDNPGIREVIAGNAFFLN